MNQAAEELRATLAPWLAALGADHLIVQIGACIGGTPPHDEIDVVFHPLLEKGNPAVLVEPQGRELKRCVATYRRKCPPEAFARLRFIEAALAENDGSVHFTVRGRGSARALSTLRMDRGFEWEKEKSYRVKELPCFTLRTLLTMAPPHVAWGWLQVDIEGHELIVLRQLSQQSSLPRLLTFEHLHLFPDEKVEALTVLSALGYTEIGWHTDDAAYVLGTESIPDRGSVRES